MTADHDTLLHGWKSIGRYLGVRPRQAEYLAETAKLPTFKLGRAVCSRASLLDEWLKAQGQPQTAA